jgi:hypothetical protein
MHQRRSLDQVQARQDKAMSEILTQDQAARLLRTKAAELEAIVERRSFITGDSPTMLPIDQVRADMALIATLVAQHLEAHALADHVQRTMPLRKE